MEAEVRKDEAASVVTAAATEAHGVRVVRSVRHRNRQRHPIPLELNQPVPIECPGSAPLPQRGRGRDVLFSPIRMKVVDEAGRKAVLWSWVDRGLNSPYLFLSRWVGCGDRMQSRAQSRQWILVILGRPGGFPPATRAALPVDGIE